MKNKLLTSITVILLSCFFLTPSSTKAQVGNITFSLLQAPCNNDGILVAYTTGFTPPITFTWMVGAQTFVQVSNSVTDTLFNYSGGFVYCQINNWAAYGYYQGAQPFYYSVSASPAICPALGSAVATVTGGLAPYTYEWTDLSNTIVGTSNPVSLPSGFYHIQITDANGCVFGSYANMDSIYIYSQSSITYTVNTTNASCTNGTATVVGVSGGIAPYSYMWSNGATTSSITGLVQGAYYVTVTDAQGCSTMQYVYIQQSPVITVNSTVTPATCLQNDGAITAFGSGGASPYSYSWNNGQNTQTASGLVTGYYTVHVTDVNGCSGDGGNYVNASTPITVTYSTTTSLCTASTGTATLNILGGTAPYVTTWNTFPAQTGITAIGLAPGNYSFNVTDNVGCVRTGTVHISPVSVVVANISVGNAMCTQANGMATVYVSSGMPPYSYSWSTGSNASSVSGLPAGGYSCTITDNMGCSIVKYANVQATTPINIGLNTTNASCIYSTNGSILATPTGGTTPYTFSWSNGNITSNNTGLGTGNYYVYVQDAAGCTAHTYGHVGYNPNNNSCYCLISGVVYEDLNNNCVQDSGEPGIENIMMHCSGLGYAYTNANGVYSFMAPTGSYTISEVVQYFYPLAACQNNNIQVSVTAATNCVSNVDFANAVNPIHDVNIYTTDFNHPVPGNNYIQYVVVDNAGTITEPGIQTGYMHDGQMPLTSVTPSIFTQQNTVSYPDWYSILTGFPTLTPGTDQAFHLTYAVPTNIPTNTIVSFKDTAAYAAPISNWLNDYTPWLNVNYHNSAVLSSYDPNFKDVTPRGTGAPGYITVNDSVLTYTIHFQNTGNYPAQNVVLIDTLDADLDLTSLDPGYSNHDYTVTVTENGVVKFTFSNIWLPDSMSSPLQSIGFVMYNIKQDNNLAVGTELKNSASIYFDYNAPVQTNTTLNTIADPSTVNENAVFNSGSYSLFPNPAGDQVKFFVDAPNADANAELRFINLTGQVVKTQTVNLTTGINTFRADITELPAGLYFAEIISGNQNMIRKLSVVH